MPQDVWPIFEIPQDSIFSFLHDDRENSLNNRGNDFDCLELAGFVRTLFLKLGWVLTPLQAWNIDPACEHRNAGGGRDMVLADDSPKNDRF